MTSSHLSLFFLEMEFFYLHCTSHALSDWISITLPIGISNKQTRPTTSACSPAHRFIHSLSLSLYIYINSCPSQTNTNLLSYFPHQCVRSIHISMLSTKKHGKALDAPSSSSSTPGKAFERVFSYFDENGDGKISPSELQNCMRNAGKQLSLEDAEALVASTDSDGDGLLEFDDFMRLVKVDEEDEEEKGRSLRDAFGEYKMKGSDYITPESLRVALRQQLGESKSLEECRAMIQRFDVDGDGVVNFDEFRAMMR